MRTIATLIAALGVLIAVWTIPTPAYPQGGGECAGGMCGTPNQSGGGCGCGCGCGSILVAMTDRGDTYQFADDFDGDGIEDQYDNCPFVANYDQADADGDVVGDACDNCPAAYNPTQADMNANHIGDACDPDRDGDGIQNSLDNCPDIPNANQAATLTAGIGDACNPSNPCRVDPLTRRMVDPSHCTSAGDSDGDGITDNLDNCPFIFNPDQADLDANSIGDACDPDIDGDLVPNEVDNCATVYNPSQLDLDYDGLGDAGNWSGGAESCDTKECYVIAGDRQNCLDPNAAFSIYLTTVGDRVASGKFDIDHEITVALFSNRLGQLHNWTARFDTLPGSSNATLQNGEGSGSTLDQSPQVANCLTTDASGKCTKLNNIRFTPDEPGKYTIRVTATLPGGDGAGATSASFAIIADVDGEPKGGCAATGAAGGLAALALALLALARRRR